MTPVADTKMSCLPIESCISIPKLIVGVNRSDTENMGSEVKAPRSEAGPIILYICVYAWPAWLSAPCLSSSSRRAWRKSSVKLWKIMCKTHRVPTCMWHLKNFSHYCFLVVNITNSSIEFPIDFRCDIFTCFLYLNFMCMCVLLPYMPVHHTCTVFMEDRRVCQIAWEFQTDVSCHEAAGN